MTAEKMMAALWIVFAVGVVIGDSGARRRRRRARLRLRSGR